MAEKKPTPPKKTLLQCFKKKSVSPKQPPVSSSAGEQLLGAVQASSLQVKDKKKFVRISPSKLFKKKGDSHKQPLVSSSSGDQLSDTAQAIAEVHDEEFVPTQHPTGDARFVACSPLDLEREEPGENLQLPPLSTSPLRQMFASPSTKTPEQSAEDSANRKPSRVCSECEPNVYSPGSVCSHIAQASRQLQFDRPTDRPTGGPTESTQPTRPSRSAVFGLKLGEDLAATGSDIPRVIALCSEIIEAWCTKNKTNCIYIYQLPEDQEQIKAIVKAFAEGDDTDFANQGFLAKSYGAVLKKYLRELPNPVIPVEMYDLFCDFLLSGSVTLDTGTTVTTITDLVNTMPVVHRHTLEFLLRHFTKLLRWQEEANPEITFGKLLREVSNVLIRPPWDRIELVTEYTLLHNAILTELLRAGSWGEIPPNIPPAMPFQPPARPPRSEDSGFVPQSPSERLHDAAWYWGEETRDYACEVLNKQPEGSFLVRDSASFEDVYTLMLKFNSSIVSLRIYCNEEQDLFGFAEPLEYPSVVTLINWYQCHTLADYNRSLTTMLGSPVLRGVAQATPSTSLPVNVDMLFKINQRFRKQKAVYYYLFKWNSWLAADTSLKVQALWTYESQIPVLQIQVQSRRANGMTSADPEIKRLESLCNRMQNCRDMLVTDIHKQTLKLRLLSGENILIKQEFKFLKKKRLEWMTHLTKQGMDKDLVERLANLVQSEWLVDCDRVEAESLLALKVDGTFLIRPKPEDNTHVLSIIYHGCVIHSKIFQKNNHYSFSEAYFPFISLKDLVDYYHYRELVLENGRLNSCLVFPIKLFQSPVTSQWQQPVAARSDQPVAAQSEQPKATQSEQPKATQSEQPKATQSEQPKATQSEQPKATQSEQPKATQSEQPKATQSEQPEATQSEQPEETL